MPTKSGFEEVRTRGSHVIMQKKSVRKDYCSSA
ncbi:MAG TPA: type II toxin-antitoxin system HicA family toxin [Candidatus Binatia bacterium]